MIIVEQNKISNKKYEKKPSNKLANKNRTIKKLKN